MLSLNIGCAIEEAFRAQISTKIDYEEVNSGILKFYINDNLSKARAAYYNKSKYIVTVSTNKQDQAKMLKETKQTPLWMGNSMIENPWEEKYLEDEISIP